MTKKISSSVMKLFKLLNVVTGQIKSVLTDAFHSLHV